MFVNNGATTQEYQMAGKENIIGKGFENNPGNINIAGRKKGSQNRNTIARQVLAMIVNIPPKQLKKWREVWPQIEDKMTGEMMITMAAQYRAIQKDASYKVLMDSAYGAPKQEIDMTSDGERINPTVNVVMSTAPLSNSEKEVKI